MAQEAETIQINTEFIRLDALLKFASVVSSGGEGKALIQEGLVRVNDEICTMRGKKLRHGDKVSALGQTLLVQGADIKNES